MNNYEQTAAVTRKRLILPISTFVVAAILLPLVGAGPISLSKVKYISS